MRKMTLKPDETRRFVVGSAKWLIVRESEEYLYLVTDVGERIRIEAGDKLDVTSFTELDIYNPFVVDIDIVFQLTKAELNPVSVPKIIFPGGVSVTEVRGVVHTSEKPAQRFISREHIIIQPNKKQRLCYASVVRLEAIIQNISQTEAEIMLGDSKVSAVAGLPILGDRKNPAGMTLTGGGELWAYNNSNVPARITILEVHR